MQSKGTELRKAFLPVEHTTQYTNVYHCCVWKTGSQWITSLLSDPVTYQYSSLGHYDPSRYGADMREIPTDEREYRRPFPAGTAVGPLYISFGAYQRISKEGPSRALFVIRDPRDIIVSWYHSAKTTHIVEKDSESLLYRSRKKLQRVSLEEGIKHSIDHLTYYNTFDAMRSWVQQKDREDVLILRFEDIAQSNNFDEFRKLFNFFDIQITDDKLQDLLYAYSFERLTGRKRGEEVNTDSHLRGGKEGGWQDYFTDDVWQHFSGKVGKGLIETLGYPIHDRELEA
jgi:hypothetical protein